MTAVLRGPVGMLLVLVLIGAGLLLSDAVHSVRNGHVPTFRQGPTVVDFRPASQP